MDLYGLSSPDLLRIDDLLDFSNEDIFSASSSTSTAATNSSSSFPPPQNPNFHHHHHHHLPSSADHSFLHDICVPTDDAAHLEWLSQFVDDSFANYPANPLGGTMASVKTEPSLFPGKPRSKRSRAPAAFAGTWTPMQDSDHQFHVTGKLKPKKEPSSGGGGRHQHHHHQSPATETAEGGIRRCTHCASEKTPQWRTGPLGPKTLCNACGVRFKSGRLVPEYRPASSPTFVLTQHSNSHRKVMELRRQKEVMRQPPQVQLHHHHHHHQSPF